MGYKFLSSRVYSTSIFLGGPLPASCHPSWRSWWAAWLPLRLLDRRHPPVLRQGRQDRRDRGGGQGGSGADQRQDGSRQQQCRPHLQHSHCSDSSQDGSCHGAIVSTAAIFIL